MRGIGRILSAFRHVRRVEQEAAVHALDQPAHQSAPALRHGAAASLSRGDRSAPHVAAERRLANSLRNSVSRRSEPLISATDEVVPPLQPLSADAREFMHHRLGVAHRLIDNNKTLFTQSVHQAFQDFSDGVQNAEPSSGKPELKSFENKLVRLLARHLAISETGRRKRIDTVNAHYRRELVEALNGDQWQTIQKSFYHNDKFYHSRMTPAAQMKLGERCIFEHDYQDKGVCSGTTTCTEHAVNLWISEFSVSSPDNALTRKREIPLFRGIRHGVLSPYGLETDEDRRKGALARAREVVAAAIYAQPAKRQQALGWGAAPALHLRLTSSSLLTAFNFGKQAERTQLEDQLRAWDTLSRQRPCIITLFDEAGKSRQVMVNLEVAAFNFGVNEAALGLGAGWPHSDRRNKQSMSILLGHDPDPDAPFGGWVGGYLDSHPDAPNAARVRELAGQIRTIWSKRMHRRDGGEPYKMAQRIALLSHEIGVMPCYNCKSGKDRTGMLDSEIKREAARMHYEGSLSRPGSRLSKKDRQLFQQVLQHSGNLEIQKRNTGVPGNKVLKKNRSLLPRLSLANRIDDEDVFKRARGLSRYVRA